VKSNGQPQRTDRLKAVLQTLLPEDSDSLFSRNFMQKRKNKIRKGILFFHFRTPPSSCLHPPHPECKHADLIKIVLLYAKKKK